MTITGIYYLTRLLVTLVAIPVFILYLGWNWFRRRKRTSKTRA